LAGTVNSLPIAHCLSNTKGIQRDAVAMKQNKLCSYTAANTAAFRNAEQTVVDGDAWKVISRERSGSFL